MSGLYGPPYGYWADDPNMTESNRPTVKTCIFCQPDNPEIHTVITHSPLAYVRLDNFPLTKGHIEIVPYRHVGSVFDLTLAEVTSITMLARRIRQHPPLSNADGYTIGINDGAAAGQTIPHMHLHIIPRHFGDVPNPRGGIRNIFPDDSYSKGPQ